MGYKKLGDYISEYTQRNTNSLNIPVYSVTNSQGFCTEYFNKDVSGSDKSKYKIVPRGFFAYNPSRINVGSIDWQSCEDNVIVSPLYVIFKCSDELDQDYLKYFLKSIEGKQMIATKVSGSVRNNLRYKDLASFEFNIGTIKEQREIVDRLKTLEQAITNEEQQIFLLDELIKARFVEMFGDLYINNLNWPKLKVEQAVTVAPQNGMYKPQSDYVTDGTGVPILRIDGFYNGDVTNWNALKRLNCSDNDLEKYLLVEDDIVINRVNSIEYLGKCAHISRMVEPTVYESNMMRMHFDPARFNPIYIARLLCTQYVYDQIVNHAKKAVNQASINQKDVLDFNIYQPPKELQDQYANFVKQINKSKAEARKRKELYKELIEKKISEYYMD